MKSSVFDRGIWCFSPVSTNLWQANLLAYKEDKILNLSRFLTEDLDLISGVEW